ncbi:hypothetical protein [Actinophytocola sp.]|uniref:hypothetical protein n=1 Tax=Actinophytocola sp. TaxID=1872138 RepID=UPI002D7ED9E2|nr:hypothetical protein [Actinophytocola sp.]HET9144063.1 hypothetical protein [Actinophytocola sp.]
MKITKLAAALGSGVAALAVVLTACDSTGYADDTSYHTEDCDAEDLAHFEDDCGYWAADGTFVTWYWVGPYGGYRPVGWHPYIPYGGHVAGHGYRPSNANTTAKPTPQPRPSGAPKPSKAAPTASVPKYTPPPAPPKKATPTGGGSTPLPKYTPPKYTPPKPRSTR